ncbi:MAG: hypothetical protein JNM07_11975 [Phycisphaerae bacterium]|nr:hypothetical protein [Phycisphaerae bacterium]
MPATRSSSIRRLATAWALACAACAVPALARQSEHDLIAELGRLSSGAIAGGEGSAGSDARADRAIEIRRALLARRGDDPRVPAWMIEQASALLERAGRDGSDLACLLGQPEERQRSVVEAAWREAAQLTESAEARSAEGADGTARGAFIRARALSLGASIAPAPADRLANARAAIAQVEETEGSAPGAESARRVVIAGACVQAAEALEASGAGGHAEAASFRRKAAELYRSVLDATTRGARSEWALRAEAAFGLVVASPDETRLRRHVAELAEIARREPFVTGPTRRADALLAVLCAGATARAELRVPGAERAVAPRLSGAVRAWLALLPRQDLALDEDARRAIVFRAVAALVPRDASFEDLPPEAALACGVEWSREPVGRPEALRILRQLSDRPDAGELASRALWERAVIMSASAAREDRMDAARALLRVAREWPRSGLAAQAAGAAPRLARTCLTRGASGAKSETDPAAAELYEQAVILAAEFSPALAEAELWRLERGRLKVESFRMDPARLSLPVLDGLLTGLERITEDEGLARDADALAVESIEMASSRAAAREDGAAPDHAAWDRVLGVARRAEAWAVVRAPALADRYRLVAGEAMLERSDPAARATFDDLSARLATLAAPDRLRVRLGLGRAQRASGEADRAFETLRDLVQELDRAARGPDRATRPAEYWSAWRTMLDILGEDNATGASGATPGSRAPAIRLAIRRLELIDPRFGGDAALRERVDSLRRMLGNGNPGAHEIERPEDSTSPLPSDAPDDGG